jgi:GT2 family glycosyltransferase
LIRKSVIDQIGLFEPAFFAHMEEIDFCWRAKNFGYRIMCQPESVVYHVGGGSLPQGNPRKTFLNVRNSLAMMFMNLPSGQRFLRIFTRLVLDGVWGVKSLTSGDLGTIVAILRAHFAFYGTLRLWAGRRREIYTGLPPVPPDTGYFSRSIVWQYYVRGVRLWKDLDF